MNSTTASSSNAVKEGPEAVFFGSDSCSSSPNSSSDEYQGSNAYLEHAAAGTGADADSYDPVGSYECASSKGVAQKAASSVKFSSPTSDSKRIINFGSGFKIPKRPSNEIADKKESEGDEPPPAKKQKSSGDDKTAAKTALVVKKKLIKTTSSDAALSVPKSTGAEIAKNDAVKKTAKKVVKHDLHDSNAFMDALNTASEIATTKRFVAKAKAKHSNDITTTNSSNSPYLINKTSSLTDSVNLNYTNLVLARHTSDISKSEEMPTGATGDFYAAGNDESRVSSGSNLSQTGKSNLSEPGVKKTNKKKVYWADHCSKPLEQVNLFILDETERVIKKAAFKGGDIAKMDKAHERELRNHLQGFSEETVEQVEPPNLWPSALTPIDLPETTIIAEVKSDEFFIQQEREQTTLAMLVFNSKQFLPDAPSEPDALTSAEFEALRPTIKIIPLEDVNESDDSFNQSKSYDEPPIQKEPVSLPQPLMAPSLLPTLMSSSLLPTLMASSAPAPAPLILTPAVTLPIDTQLFSAVNPSSLSDEATEQIKQILKHIERQQVPAPAPPPADPQPSSLDYGTNVMQSEHAAPYESNSGNYRNDGYGSKPKWGAWNNSKPYPPNRPNFNPNHRNFNANTVRKPGPHFHQRHQHTGFNPANNGRNQFGQTNYRNNGVNHNNRVNRFADSHRAQSNGTESGVMQENKSVEKQSAKASGGRWI